MSGNSRVLWASLWYNMHLRCENVFVFVRKRLETIQSQPDVIISYFFLNIKANYQLLTEGTSKILYYTEVVPVLGLLSTFEHNCLITNFFVLFVFILYFLCIFSFFLYQTKYVLCYEERLSILIT